MLYVEYTCLAIKYNSRWAMRVPVFYMTNYCTGDLVTRRNDECDPSYSYICVGVMGSLPFEHLEPVSGSDAGVERLFPPPLEIQALNRW